MAHQLKYILQYYALGTSTAPYYQWKIFQDSAKWASADGPIFLRADGDEPTTIELFESDGPIKPSSVLLNLINSRYSPVAAHEVDDDTTVLNSIAGVLAGLAGAGDMWAVGDSGAISYWDDDVYGSPTAQTSGTANDLNTIDVATETKAICAGDAGTILTTGNAGSTWTSRTVWAGTPEIRAITYSIASSSVIAAGGVSSLGRSTDSGVNWTDYDSKVSGNINSLALPTSANLFLISGTTLNKITTFDGTPSSASAVSGVDSGTVDQVDFYDANNGVSVGINNTYLTIDGGSTWVKTGNPSATTKVDGLHYVSLDLMVIVDRAGVVFWSQDGGWNWTTITADSAVTGGHLTNSGNAIFYNSTRESCFEVTTLGELSKAVITDYLREFVEIDFAEYYVTLERSTTDHETGGGTQQRVLSQMIIDSEFGYSEDWEMPVNSINQVRVTDGFNIWMALEYRTGAGALQTGRKKITVLLGDALELIYSGFGTTDFYETYITYLNDNLGSDFSTSPTDATNPFVNGFVDAEHFLHEPTKPYTWWEVITAIFTDYDCSLISNLLLISSTAGSPQIIANDRFYNTVTNDNLARLRYETNGTFNGPPDNIYVRDLNSATSIFQGRYEVREKPYQYIEATIVNARPVSIVPDYNFELEKWSSTSALHNWTGTNLVIARSTTTDSDNYSEYSCNITSEASSLGEGTLASIKTRIPSGTTSIYLQFKYHCDTTVTAPAVGIEGNPNFYIQVKYGDQFLYDGTTLKPDPSTHSATNNIIDYSGITWSTSEAWLLVIVSGDSMDSWITLNLGEITSPADTSGDFQILISEPVNSEYTINNFYLDEIYIIPLGGNGVFYEDIKLIGENTAISNGKRLDLGKLHFYDYPQIVNNDYSSAVLSEVTLIVDQVTPPSDGDAFALDLDGTNRTLTFRTSPSLAGEWNTQQDLIDEIYRYTNHYFVWESDGVNGKITIHALDYIEKDFGVISAGGARLSIENQADFTAPSTSTWTNRATITDDATPTTAADWTWHAVTQEATGTEDTEMWKLRFERELARRGLSSQFLQGTYKILSEGTDIFGGIMGLLPPSTLDNNPKNYRPISTRGNSFMGEWEILHEKVHDESVTFVGEEVFEE